MVYNYMSMGNLFICWLSPVISRSAMQDCLNESVRISPLQDMPQLSNVLPHIVTQREATGPSVCCTRPRCAQLSLSR